eukprot:268370-Prymnesium_polylepis.1
MIAYWELHPTWTRTGTAQSEYCQLCARAAARGVGRGAHVRKTVFCEVSIWWSCPVTIIQLYSLPYRMTVTDHDHHGNSLHDGRGSVTIIHRMVREGRRS